MQDFEKLGAFYLGRPYELHGKAPGQGLVLYDSRDLTTHGVIIGMTGSGKTGLAIDLLEEAAIDGVPAIAIDPKGDLPNMLLGFPGLSGEEFRPWINEDEAARLGLTADQFAEVQATSWREGLAAWGQDGARISRLRGAVDLAVYTPGSSAGLPLSILRSFAAPPPEVRDDQELVSERVGTTVTALLTLVGVDADPVRSREHILLSTIVGTAWRAGEDLDLGGLIQRIQTPPVTRVGVLELEAFFPSKDRFELAMRLNGLLAAPGFAAWLEGEPIDAGRLFFTGTGKPRISIVSIAHLGDAERMFLVSLLLNEVLLWVRRQPGTTSLRALLYMDEVAGYLPPVASPPSKSAFMTLLKQARAFGVGVVLATQNPGDLDYKALSNIGTWMVGRLQTDRDKDKVLEGLEGALGGTGRFDRGDMDRVLSALGKRIFLMHNVHDDGPVVFETRWTLSYLRGPLTREQIKKLMAPRLAAASVLPAGPAAPVAARGTTSTPATERPLANDRCRTAVPPTALAGPGLAASRPVLAPDVPQFFVPYRGAEPPTYEPRVFAAAQVQFLDPRLGVNELREVAVLAPFVNAPVPVDFAAAASADVPLSGLETDPKPGASFSDLPAAAARAKNYESWKREFARLLYQTQQLELFRDPASGLTARPGEREADFRIRAQLAQREARDAGKAKLQQKYAPKLARLNERLRRAQERVARESDQASSSKVDTAVSVGTSLLGALFGRKTLTAANLGRVTTAARRASRSVKESKDVQLAESSVEAVRGDIQHLEDELAAEVVALQAGLEAASAPLEVIVVKPRKTHVAVQAVLLVWRPR